MWAPTPAAAPTPVPIPAPVEHSGQLVGCWLLRLCGAATWTHGWSCSIGCKVRSQSHECCWLMQVCKTAWGRAWVLNHEEHDVSKASTNLLMLCASRVRLERRGLGLLLGPQPQLPGCGSMLPCLSSVCAHDVIRVYNTVFHLALPSAGPVHGFVGICPCELAIK